MQLSFGTKTDLSNAHLRAFGEEYHSVKQLTSKMCIAFETAYGMAAGTPYHDIGIDFVNFPWSLGFGATLPVGGDWRLTYAGWFARAYLGYRGGMRVSFHTTNPLGEDMVRSHYLASHIVGTSVATNPVSPVITINTQDRLSEAARDYAFGVGNRLVCPIADFVAPAQHQYDFVNTRQTLSRWYDTVEVTVGIKGTTSVTAVNLQFEYLTATADDGNFCFFLGFPTVP